jgi:hypothetical protein
LYKFADYELNEVNHVAVVSYFGQTKFQ